MLMTAAPGRFTRATTPSDRPPIPSYGRPTSNAVVPNAARPLFRRNDRPSTHIRDRPCRALVPRQRFSYLCEKNAVTHNPVKGVERPRTESGEGKTPAIGDHQARKLLDAPQDDTVKSKRDRAILSTLLFHALRREELCKLKVKDLQHARKGVPHLKVSGKGGKTRYVPLHPGTHALIHDYLDAATQAPMKTVRCSGQSATTARVGLRGRLPATAFTGWCGAIRRCSVLRSGRIRYA
jgi:site-specific recombinase XerC